MKSEKQDKPPSQTSSLAIISNSKRRKSTKSQSADCNALSQTSFEGTGLSYKGKIIGDCDVTPFPGDQLTVCSEALSLLKMKVSSRKKQRVEILLQWGVVKIVEEVSTVEVQHHSLQKLEYVWKNPSSDKIFGIIIREPSITSTEEDEKQKQTFYAYKMDRKVETFLSHFKNLYQLWIDEEEKKWRASRSVNIKLEDPEPTAQDNGSPQEEKSLSNLLDLHSDLPLTNVNNSPTQIFKELLINESNQRSSSSLFNKSLSNGVVQNDPWTGSTVFMDIVTQPLENGNGYNKSVQNGSSILTTVMPSSPTSGAMQIPNTKYDSIQVMGPHSSWNTATCQSPWSAASSIPITENPLHSTSHPLPSSPPNDPLTAAFQELRLSSQFGVKGMNWSFTTPKLTHSNSSASASFCTNLSQSNEINVSPSTNLFSDLLQMNTQTFTRGNSEEFEKQFAEAEARRMSKGVRNPRPSLDELKGLPKSWKF